MVSINKVCVTYLGLFVLLFYVHSYPILHAPPLLVPAGCDDLVDCPVSHLSAYESFITVVPPVAIVLRYLS